MLCRIGSMERRAGSMRGLLSARHLEQNMSTRQQLEAEWAKASGYATAPCPFCDGKDPELFCEHCLGSRVVLSTHKVPFPHWRSRLLAWGVICFLIACGLLWILLTQPGNMVGQ